MHRYNWAIALLLALFCGCADKASGVKDAPALKMVASFEDGTVQDWCGSYGTTVTVSEEHATDGKKSLRADIPAGPYPGITLDFKAAQDWSPYGAFRFSVFNASTSKVRLCVRVDDAGSQNFATRYNNDMIPHTVDPGANEVELTTAALRQGGFLSRGLDVSRIRAIRIFSADLKTPVTLFFDAFRLVRGDRTGPDTLVLADFGGKDAAQWKASDGVTGEVFTMISPPAEGSQKVLKLEFSSGGQYPGVTFTGLPRDWLSYDLLKFEALCTQDMSPHSMQLKLTDAVGRRQTVSFPLNEMDNAVCVPLEIFAEVSLGQVQELALFTSAPTTKQELCLSNLALQRVGRVDFPTVYAAQAINPGLTLDLTGMAKVPRNTCFMGMVFIQLSDGRTRVVRCNSPGKGEVKYAIPAEAFEGYRKDGAAGVWVYVSDHGVWSYWHREAQYAGAPLTVGFEP